MSGLMGPVTFIRAPDPARRPRRSSAGSYTNGVGSANGGGSMDRAGSLIVITGGTGPGINLNTSRNGDKRTSGEGRGG